jgi:hypothetical protein
MAGSYSLLQIEFERQDHLFDRLLSLKILLCIFFTLGVSHLIWMKAKS